MISIELNNVFRESVRYAKENRHEYLTLEHIFLSILNSKEGVEILSAVGGNIEYMKELTKKLKSKPACGGTMKDGKIELQGAHIQKVKEMLLEAGFRPETINIQ